MDNINISDGDQYAKIFQKSISSSLFPIHFKETKLTLLSKKDDNNVVINYRPIAVLNCIAKLYEFIIYERIFCTF